MRLSGGDTALLHGSKSRTNPPFPERRSRNFVAVWHPEAVHRIENPARKSYLHSLTSHCATRHVSADEHPHSQSFPSLVGGFFDCGFGEGGHGLWVSKTRRVDDRDPWIRIGRI